MDPVRERVAELGRGPAIVGEIIGLDFGQGDRTIVSVAVPHDTALGHWQVDLRPLGAGAATDPVAQALAGFLDVFDFRASKDDGLFMRPPTDLAAARFVAVYAMVHSSVEVLCSADEYVELEVMLDNVLASLPSVALVKGRSAINRRPGMIQLANGTRILFRIPQRDGRGVMGLHPDLAWWAGSEDRTVSIGLTELREIIRRRS